MSDRTGFKERGMITHGGYRIGDMAVMLAMVSASLATWACPCDIAGASPWKSYVSVGVAVVLALAALTRHPGWTAATRLLMGAWLIAAPYALGFAGMRPAGKAYPTIGVLVVMTAVPWLRLARQALRHSGSADGVAPAEGR